MKNILAVFCLFSFSTVGMAQVSYEAVRFTDQVIEGSWKNVETVIPAILAGLKTQLETSGASKEASKALTDELQRNFTKENLARGYSKQVFEKFTADEIAKLSEFYSSAVGQKFLKFGTSEEANTQSVQYIMKTSCDSVKQKLGFFDRGTINSVCGKF